MIIPPSLKLRHIRVFLAVAELESVTAAAQRLHVSQPALSKTLADLEALVGEPLFDRAGRRMALTVPGALFRRHALGAMHGLETGLRAVRGESAVEVLPVGVLPTVAGSLFPGVVQAFAQARPSAIVSVTTGPHGYLLDRLRKGEIELMIGRMPEPDEMAGLRFEFLYEDAIELVARRAHPLIDAGAARALRNAPVIMPTRESIIRKIVDGFLNAQGFADLRPSLETVSPNLALPLLLASDMLWFISRGVVARELESGSLATIDLGAGYMSGAVGVTLRYSAESSQNADYLLELLHASASARDHGARPAP